VKGQKLQMPFHQNNIIELQLHHPATTASPIQQWPTFGSGPSIINGQAAGVCRCTAILGASGKQFVQVAPNCIYALFSGLGLLNSSS
jgi:hypothetical protein